MFVNKLDNLDGKTTNSQQQEQRRYSEQQLSASNSRPKDLDFAASSASSQRPSSSASAGSGSVTPTMEDRGRPTCPSTPPSSPVMPRRRPSTPPNSPKLGRRHQTPQQQQQQEKRPTLYDLGYDLLLSACQNSYPWYLSQPPMPAEVEASPSPATATPTVTPPPSRFNSLKKKYVFSSNENSFTDKNVI